ncbi:hypothetical protein BGZ60DRAFT_193711 [Tricladium varicosporioides]|nr:hypothetical protein BGZ60DRAFT_193711 [Hymenoscyphus varicosporioides]
MVIRITSGSVANIRIIVTLVVSRVVRACCRECRDQGDQGDCKLAIEFLLLPGSAPRSCSHRLLQTGTADHTGRQRNGSAERRMTCSLNACLLACLPLRRFMRCGRRWRQVIEAEMRRAAHLAAARQVAC